MDSHRIPGMPFELHVMARGQSWISLESRRKKKSDRSMACLPLIKMEQGWQIIMTRPNVQPVNPSLRVFAAQFCTLSVNFASSIICISVSFICINREALIREASTKWKTSRDLLFFFSPLCICFQLKIITMYMSYLIHERSKTKKCCRTNFQKDWSFEGKIRRIFCWSNNKKTKKPIFNASQLVVSITHV